MRSPEGSMPEELNTGTAVSKEKRSRIHSSLGAWRKNVSSSTVLQNLNGNKMA